MFTPAVADCLFALCVMCICVFSESWITAYGCITEQKTELVLWQNQQVMKKYLITNHVTRNQYDSPPPHGSAEQSRTGSP